MHNLFLTYNDLLQQHQVSIQNGTEAKFCNVALEWAQRANKELIRLTNENERLANEVRTLIANCRDLESRLSDASWANSRWGV